MYKEITKMGYQCPKKLQMKWFNIVEMMDTWHSGNGNLRLKYNKEYDFVYNQITEEQKLYDGKDCYYTDKRFDTDSYDDNDLFHNAKRRMNLSSCILKSFFTKGIPSGTIVRFASAYLEEGYKEHDLSYYYQIEKENPIDITYNIDCDSFSQNFTHCEKSKDLVNALRDNGFLVSVYPNTNFLMSMLKNACDHTDKDSSVINTSEEGEIAIAYGFGKKIGFSSFKNPLRGYYNGRTNILWDCFGHFDKWSNGQEISKDTPIEKLIALFKTPNTEIASLNDDFDKLPTHGRADGMGFKPKRKHVAKHNIHHSIFRADL